MQFAMKALTARMGVVMVHAPNNNTMKKLLLRGTTGGMIPGMTAQTSMMMMTSWRAIDETTNCPVRLAISGLVLVEFVAAAS